MTTRTCASNTAAAKLIEYTNHLTKAGVTARAALEPLVLMVAPLAPHLAEELWSRLGHRESLAYGPFPVADERYLVTDTVEYPVQVNGKVRGRITVASDADRSAVEAAALGDEKVVAFLAARSQEGDRGTGPSGEPRPLTAPISDCPGIRRPQVSSDRSRGAR